MSKPLDFTFYNPDQLDDEAFLAGFVARQNLVDKILARLGDIKRRGLAQHRLIVGQRGMGKTSLLRRIALGVREQSRLAEVLLPLSFREEQYNVHNLHVFWCNCLDALGDWFEASGRQQQAARLDREVAALNAKQADEEGSEALALFRRWMKEEQRRPLLLLDNLDIILTGLKKKDWSLRRALQEPGGIVVIGASAAALEAAADREGAFYEFFQVDVLAKLEHHEILLCLRHIARQREEPGRKVLQILDRDPARIHTLYDLTGGNPRTLAMLYLVLETSGDEDVMRDLERLLDQATPVYKARVEELASQTRVVFDALALAWDPATAADLADVTGLEVSVVSAQLDRLVKAGVVEKTSLSSQSRTAFQVGERFFNIWYLMRHSPRRQRQRLRWLTEMLRRIYSPRELHERAISLLGDVKDARFSRATFCLALSDAVQDRELRTALRSSVGRNSLISADDDAQFEDDISWPLVAPASIESGGTAVATDITAQAYRKAIEQNSEDPGLWRGLGKLLWNLEEARSEAEAAFRKALELDPNYVSVWFDLGILLAGPLGRHTEAEEAYRKILALDPNNVEAWNNLGVLLAGPLECHAEAEATFHRALELDPKDVRAWFNLGFLLESLLGRPAEAEAAYRKVLELDPKNLRAWNNLGLLLAGPLKRYAEAEAAYRKVLELDPKNLRAWNNLGLLLAGPLERHTEAEAAYREALELDPKYVRAWNNLGLLLAGPLGRHTEAEVAFRKALDLDPKYLWALHNLGHLLEAPLERFGEAETVFREAGELDPNTAWPWIHLCFLLAGPLERHAEAEVAFRKAIELSPKGVMTWIGFGNLLADHLFRLDEAEQAYLAAMEIDPRNIFAVANLAYLLIRQDGRKDDAESAYKSAIMELPPHGAGLLRAFYALAADNFGTATAELRTVLDEGHPELFTVFRDDLLRVLQFAAERGHGERLLSWLRGSEFGDRFWPLHVAFDAYLHGEERLMDVNPEVRNGARRLLAAMTRRPSRPPQPEPGKKLRRKGRES